MPDPGGGTQVLHAGLVVTYPGARPFTRRLPLLCTVVAAVLVIVFATYSDLAAAPPAAGGWSYLAADSGELGPGATSDAATAMAAGGQARRPTEAILAVAVQPPLVTDRPLSAPLGAAEPAPQIPQIARPPSGAASAGRVARPVAAPRTSSLAALGAGVTATGGGWHTAYVSWYGPGFYGKRTACGLAYTREIIGVAHRTLPCGTRVQFRNGGRVITASVIDRGPYVAGRNWDLSAGLCTALGHCYTGNIQWRFP